MGGGNEDAFEQGGGLDGNPAQQFVLKRAGYAETQKQINAERTRQRDVAAFEQLVTRYRSKVYGLAVRMMQDASDAEEVVQESFLSA